MTHYVYERHHSVYGDGIPADGRCSNTRITELPSGSRPQAICQPDIRRWCQMSRPHDPSGNDPTALLLTVPEAARILAVGRTSLYQLIWDGQLAPVRIGRSVRFTIAELERFVAERAALDPMRV